MCAADGRPSPLRDDVTNGVSEDVAVHGGGPAFAETSIRAKTWSLFLGLALLMLGNGLSGALLGVRAESEGFGTTVSGLVMTSYFVGFLGGTRYVEHALRTVGHIRVFAGLASTASSVVLLQVIWIDPIAWALLRMSFGLCVAGLYVVVESWLNDLATNRTRGLILAVYMVVSMGALGAGQFLINVGDPEAFVLFALASVLVSMSLVPVALSASSTPPVQVPTTLGFRELVAIAPTGVVSAFLVGVAIGVLIGLGAVYGAATGMSTSELSLFLAAPMLGAVLFQLPIGRLSDRLPRRGVMLAVASAATALAGCMLLVDDTSPIGYAVMCLLGSTLYPLYSLAIAYTNDWLEPGQMMGASAMLVRVNGTGAIIGPLVGAVLLAVDLQFFYWTLIGAQGLIVLFLLQRIVARDPVPIAEQGPFQPFPGRASRMAVRLLHRRPSPPSRP